MLEDAELHSLIRLGTSYGRTQLSRDHLKLVLENEDWYQVPEGKFGKPKGKGKGKERREFKGGMLIEKPPKGKGERPDKRTLPKGRRPNPDLEGGEGIEPYELYSNALDTHYGLKKEQACTYYCSFDVGAYSRTDTVYHPPKAVGPKLYSSTSTGLGDGKGADRERGPGLSSGPQQSHEEDWSDDESFDHTDPPMKIMSREEEQWVDGGI